MPSTVSPFLMSATLSKSSSFLSLLSKFLYLSPPPELLCFLIHSVKNDHTTTHAFPISSPDGNWKLNPNSKFLGKVLYCV